MIENERRIAVVFPDGGEYYAYTRMLSIIYAVQERERCTPLYMDIRSRSYLSMDAEAEIAAYFRGLDIGKQLQIMSDLPYPEVLMWVWPRGFDTDSFGAVFDALANEDSLLSVEFDTRRGRYSEEDYRSAQFLPYNRLCQG